MLKLSTVIYQPIQFVSNIVDKLTSKIKKMFNKNVKVKIIFINLNALEKKKCLLMSTKMVNCVTNQRD